MSKSLSPRQEAVLQKLANGQTQKQIAQALKISPETVRSHCEVLKNKLGAQNNAHVVHVAYCTGWLAA